MKKLQVFDSIYFRGKSHFEEDDTQNYLVFEAMYRYFKRVSDADTGNYSYFWKSKGWSNESIIALTTSDYGFNPQLNYVGNKIRVEFKGSCLKQDIITCNYGKIVNVIIVYEISKNFDISKYPTLENCLFGAVSLHKNADIDRCKYFGYGIGFDRHGFIIDW